MKKTYLISFISGLCLVCAAHAVEVIEPSVHTAQFNITSPDDTVATLGKVSIIIDLAAEHDSLFELQIRRKNLQLEDGRAVSVFGYNKEGGVIVAASAPVTHISVAGVQGKDILALFHNDHNEVIAPNKKDVRLFDLNFNPISFDYSPATPPINIGMDVSILIDHSGSMSGHMPDVIQATRDFMSSLPDFTRCHVLTFNEKVTLLTSAEPGRLSSCPNSLQAISRPIKAEGGTALFYALENAFNQSMTTHSQLPHLVIVLTDGVNNQPHTLSFDQLVALKNRSNGKLLTFWVGSYDPAHLKGLADLESVSGANIKNDLDMFFHSIGVSVSGLQTLIMQK